MEVGVSELRAHLRDWLERVRGDEEIVVTDNGTPVARLVPAASTTALERLEHRGLIRRSRAPRGAASAIRRVKPRGSISELVAEQRR